MTEDNSGGINDQASGDIETTDTVKHETYKKVLNEKKALQTKLAERDAIIAQAQQEKLEAEGKWQELAQANKKAADEFKEKNFNLVKNVADKTIKSQFKSLSEKLGCVNADTAYKVCNFDDLEVTEDFEFDQAKLESKIQELTKQHPYLFKKDLKIPADVIPGKSGSAKLPSEMSTDELLNHYKQISLNN